MKRKILRNTLLLILLGISLNSYSMLVQYLKIVKLEVENDKTWEMRVEHFLEDDLDTLFIISERDSIAIDCSAITEDMYTNMSFNSFIRISSDTSGIKVYFEDEYSEWTGENSFHLSSYKDIFRISPEQDSININNHYLFDTFVFGGDSFYPPLTNGSSYNSKSNCNGFSEWYETEDNSYMAPYTIKGKVYDKNGELIIDGKLSRITDYAEQTACNSTNISINNGNFTLFEQNYEGNKGHIITHIWYNKNSIQLVFLEIEPIDLSNLPFGSVVEADIRFISDITAIDDNAWDYISIKDRMLYLDEMVEHCSIIDIAGKEVAVNSNEFSLEGFSAGVYIIKGVLSNGEVFISKVVL